MKYFIDCEFIESGPNHPIELLSCGIVAEDGRFYYMVNGEADRARANNWVKANVLPYLDPSDEANYDDLRLNLLDMTRHDPAPEFWGWCCGFDYVLISQAVGFNSWPDNWPYYFRDIQQEADRLGVPLTGEQRDDTHNALADAYEIRKLAESLGLTGG